MLRLIVNADDFGLSEAVNAGIVEAHVNGIVTSASIMANGAAFDHAIGLCESCPSLDVGVHLTLVEERPLLAAEVVPSLIGGAGRFHAHATAFMKKYLAGKIDLAEVESELEAQVRKVVDRGIAVSHLDSHQHVHALPRIGRVVVSLAEKYRIPAIRRPLERPRPYMLANGASLSRVSQLLALDAYCLLNSARPLKRTDHFAGFYFGGRLNKENLQRLLENLPPGGTCELMCHPGKDDSACRYSHWGYRRSEELRALTDPEVSESLRQKGVRLISYRQLGEAASNKKTG